MSVRRKRPLRAVTLRALLDEDDDEGEHDDLGDDRAGPAFVEFADDAQSERCPDGAGKLADAAENDDRERIDDVALAHVRADVGDLRQRDAAESGDSGAGAAALSIRAVATPTQPAIARFCVTARTNSPQLSRVCGSSASIPAPARRARRR